mgnify:CR=1 FL=1
MEKKEEGLKPFISLILSTKIPKMALTIGLIGSVITTLVSLSIPLLTRELVDGFSAASLSLSLMITIGIVFIVQAVIDGFSTYMLAAVGQRIVAKLREKMWLKLVRLPVRFFDTRASGESVSRVVNDTGVVKDLISQHFPQFITGVISIIGATTILFIMDWKMTLLMFIAVPVTTIVMIPIGKRMQKVSRNLQDETAVFSGKIQQTLSEIRLMKASTAEQFEETKGKTRNYEFIRIWLKRSTDFCFNRSAYVHRHYVRHCDHNRLWRNSCCRRINVNWIARRLFALSFSNYIPDYVLRDVLHPNCKRRKARLSVLLRYWMCR